MKEPTPSKEAQSILLNYGGEKLALAIDALTEQRVAAAVQKERERCAGIADNEAEDYRAMYVLEGFREDLRLKDAAARIATLVRRKPSDRPAPEGAARELAPLIAAALVSARAELLAQIRDVAEREMREITFPAHESYIWQLLDKLTEAT